MIRLLLSLSLFAALPAAESSTTQLRELFASWPQRNTQAVVVLAPAELKAPIGTHTIGVFRVPDGTYDFVIHCARATRLHPDIWADPKVQATFYLYMSTDEGRTWNQIGESGGEGGIATRPSGAEFLQLGFHTSVPMDGKYVALHRLVKVVVVVQGGVFRSTVDFQAF